MDLDNITPEKFFKKCTYADDPNPGNKIVMTNGDFVQCALFIKIGLVLEGIRRKL